MVKGNIKNKPSSKTPRKNKKEWMKSTLKLKLDASKKKKKVNQERKSAILLCQWIQGVNQRTTDIYGKDGKIPKIDGRTDLMNKLMKDYMRSRTHLKKENQSQFINDMTSYFKRNSSFYKDYDVDEEIKQICKKNGVSDGLIPCKSGIIIYSDRVKYKRGFGSDWIIL